MKLTYNELFILIQKQNQIILQLKERIAELEEQLKLNSKNSSKPSSTDKKKNKQTPKGGAKSGHKGWFRKKFSKNQITKKIISSLDKCPHCGNKNLKKGKSRKLQQVDLPEIKPDITEIECEKYQCLHCKKKFTAPFPKEYKQSNFGPKLATLIALCSPVYRMSKRSIQTLLKTLFQIDISLGQIPEMERRTSKGLEISYKELKEQIDKAKIGYVDKTTFRQQAKIQYVWTVTTNNEVFLSILPKRNIESLNQIHPRDNPEITVTDRYQVYSYKKHQYCLAHIKRDFKKFSERNNLDGSLAKQALFELKEVFLACRLTCEETKKSRIYYRSCKLKKIMKEILFKGSDDFSRFAERLLKQWEKLFLFNRYSGVECTNNAAERSLRHIVLWRKTSYGTQSESGSRFLERAISIWMTLKKQGKDVMSYFLQAYQSTYNPEISSPSLYI